MRLEVKYSVIHCRRFKSLKTEHITALYSSSAGLVVRIGIIQQVVRTEDSPPARPTPSGSKLQ